MAGDTLWVATHMYARSVTLLNNVIYVRVILIAVELIYSQHGSHNHDYATH